MNKRLCCSNYRVPRGKRKAITLKMKLDVIRRTEAGQKVRDIGKALGLVSSTICTIQKEAANIKKKAMCGTPLNASRLTRNRSDLLDQMEDILNAWIDEQNTNNLPVNTRIIQERARMIFEELKLKAASNESFIASSGWYAKFKKRNELVQSKECDEATAVARESEGARDGVCEGAGRGSGIEITHKHQKILELAASAGLDELDEEDVQELLDCHSEKLISKALCQIKKEQDMTPSCKSNLIIQNLTLANDYIETALALYMKYDPEEERSNEVCRKVREATACYAYLQGETEKEKQTSSTDVRTTENESNLPSTSQNTADMYTIIKEEIKLSPDPYEENNEEDTTHSMY